MEGQRRTTLTNYLHGQSEYKILRDGSPWLVLIPGSFDDSRYWKRIASLLPSSWGILIVTLPGHSPASTAYVTEGIESYSSLTLEMIDHAGIEGFYIGGHSIGGMIAVQMAQTAPGRVQGIISCEGWTHFSVAMKAFDGDVLGPMTERQLEERRACRDAVLVNFSQEEREQFAQIWTRWNGLRILENTSIPVLELWGTRGRPRPRRDSLMIPERANIELRWIDGAGHCLTQLAPERVAQEIRSFIQTNERKQRRINLNANHGVVWLTAQVDYEKYCGHALQMLRQKGFCLCIHDSKMPPTREEQLAMSDRIIAVLAGTEVWDEKILARCGKLKIIARFGVGVDNIDIAAARQYGVLVTNVRGANVEAVSDTTVCFMLCATKKVVEADRLLKNNIWERQYGHTLSSRTIGFIGFGNIPQRVSQKLAGFGCNMMAFDKYCNPTVFQENHVASASLEQVLKESDIVSIHVPLTEETRLMIGKAELEQMRPEAILINTARGGIVDEQALYDALINKRIACAAFDVFNREPDVTNPLFALDNFLATPHMAGAAAETFEYTSNQAAQAVIDCFENRTPQNQILA